MAQTRNTTKKNELFFVVDIGTQSIRCSLVDVFGNIIAIVKTPIIPYYATHPGWAEQDPDYYWKTISATSRKILNSNKKSKSAIQGVVITTQRATMVNVDKNGKPLRPAIVWLDQRKADYKQVLPFFLRTIIRGVFLHNIASSVVEDCDANWIMQNQPELWDKTHKYLLLSGFLTHKLTGNFTESIGNNLGYLPLDSKTYQWAKWYNYKWLLFPIDKSKLSDLKRPSEILGAITKSASKATGIPAGLPLIASGTDKGCEILGAGCLSPETGCVSYGTIATINSASDKQVYLFPIIPPYPSSVPDAYYNEISIFRGYWMVSWFKEEFGLQEKLLAKKKKIAPEQLFDQLIRDIPSGSDGLMLQPYWSPGVKDDNYKKGSIIGFGSQHTRAHVYRAILEGLAFALKEGGLLIQNKNKTPFERLRVSGGGSQSNVAMQITADIFNLPAERPHTFETSSLGAAINGAVGLGLYSDFQSAVKNMTRTVKVFHPVSENVELYENLFNDVYRKTYSRLRPLYKSLARHVR